MPDEKHDESLGLEHLPQSELEASPKTGKQPLNAPEQTNHQTIDQEETDNQFITQNNENDEIPL